MKVQLICTVCKKMITDSKKGVYVWGEKEERHPFKLVHKGDCDSWFRKNNIYSCEIDRVIEKIGATEQYKLGTREDNG